MREIVGFVAGVTAGIAGSLLVGTETGRRLRERLLTEAEPELRTALEEWDPLLREAAKAVRLVVRELEETAERAARYVSSLAEEEPLATAAPAEGTETSSDGAEGPKAGGAGRVVTEQPPEAEAPPAAEAPEAGAAPKRRRRGSSTVGPASAE